MKSSGPIIQLAKNLKPRWGSDNLGLQLPFIGTHSSEMPCTGLSVHTRIRAKSWFVLRGWAGKQAAHPGLIKPGHCRKGRQPCSLRGEPVHPFPSSGAQASRESCQHSLTAGMGYLCGISGEQQSQARHSGGTCLPCEATLIHLTATCCSSSQGCNASKCTPPTPKSRRLPRRSKWPACYLQTPLSDSLCPDVVQEAEPVCDAQGHPTTPSQAQGR